MWDVIEVRHAHPLRVAPSAAEGWWL